MTLLDSIHNENEWNIMKPKFSMRMFINLLFALVVTYSMVACPSPRHRYRVVLNDRQYQDRINIAFGVTNFEIEAFYRWGGGQYVKSVFIIKVKNQADDSLKFGFDNVKIKSKYYEYRIRYIEAEGSSGLFSSTPAESYETEKQVIKIEPYSSKTLQIISERLEDKEMNSVHPKPDEVTTLIIEEIKIGNGLLGRIEVQFKSK